MNDAVQQIKDRLNIIDVISPYAELHKAGRNFKARCPFHNEKTPSFNVSPERGMYHCYGCGVGGDMFTFIEAIEGVDFKGALKILAEKARVELVPVSPERASERDRLYSVLEAVTEFYEGELRKNTEGLSYLDKRGVTKATLESWRIGFAPGPPASSWRASKEYLEAKGFSVVEIMKAGLAKGADQGKEPYDVFRNRIMFPIFDQGGRVVAFSGRTLETGPDIPKYVNSPETELFKKSEILYGYDRAKHSIRRLDFSLIVEGQFDVVMSHQSGYHNTVAVSGTALTLEHVKLLERLSKKVVLALDADKAGIAAAKKAADMMLRRGFDVKVAQLPAGLDPADITKQDPKEFKRIIGASQHVIEFLLRILQSQNLDLRTFKLRAREEVIPYVPLLTNKIDQDHFETIIAEALKTTKDAVHYEVERAEEQMAEAGKETSKVYTPPKEAVGTEPVAQVDQSSRFLSVLTFLFGALPIFEADIQEKLVKTITDLCQKDRTELESMVSITKQAEVTFKAETYLDEFPRHLFETDVIHKLNDLRQLILQRDLALLKEQIKQAGLSGDHDEELILLGRVNMLRQQLQAAVYTPEQFFPGKS